MSGCAKKKKIFDLQQFMLDLLHLLPQQQLPLLTVDLVTYCSFSRRNIHVSINIILFFFKTSFLALLKLKSGIFKCLFPQVNRK